MIAYFAYYLQYSNLNFPLTSHKEIQSKGQQGIGSFVLTLPGQQKHQQYDQQISCIKVSREKLSEKARYAALGGGCRRWVGWFWSRGVLVDGFRFRWVRGFALYRTAVIASVGLGYIPVVHEFTCLSGKIGHRCLEQRMRHRRALPPAWLFPVFAAWPR